MGAGDIVGFIKNRPGNILINGAFELDQRNAGALEASTGYALDRWFFFSGDSVVDPVGSLRNGILEPGSSVMVIVAIMTCLSLSVAFRAAVFRFSRV